MADRFCSSCKVRVNEDLANCPLCGKYILKEGETIKANQFSYPKYNYANIQREKAVKIIKNVVIYAIVLITLVNLVFITHPVWFPLAVVPLYCLYMMFVHPFRHGGNLLISLPSIAFFASFMLIFLDAYIHYNYIVAFGWSYEFVVPFLWVTIIITCFIVGFTSLNFAQVIAKQIPIIGILSIIYLIVKLVAFPQLQTWPSFLFVATTLAWLIFVFSFRKKMFAQEMKKDFHIN